MTWRRRRWRRTRGHPRLVTSSETYELVAILEGERLTIYLDRFEDNAPVTDAAISVTIDDENVVAEPAADGTYVVCVQPARRQRTRRACVRR
jgi:hypothetical protein